VEKEAWNEKAHQDYSNERPKCSDGSLEQSEKSHVSTSFVYRRYFGQDGGSGETTQHLAKRFDYIIEDQDTMKE